jgi:hypothetical protein
VLGIMGNVPNVTIGATPANVPNEKNKDIKNRKNLLISF